MHRAHARAWQLARTRATGVLNIATLSGRTTFFLCDYVGLLWVTVAIAASTRRKIFSMIGMRWIASVTLLYHGGMR